LLPCAHEQGVGLISRYAVEGYIVVQDRAELKRHTAQLQKISVNVHQIIRQIKQMGDAYAAATARIQGRLRDLWPAERRFLQEGRYVTEWALKNLYPQGGERRFGGLS
jgi:hypothetical protein